MVEFIQNWGAMILSLISIIGCLVTYIKHDRELKNQEKRLNSLQIMQLENQGAKEKMAVIKCEAIHFEKGREEIRFSNIGSSDSRNVRVKILNPETNLNGVIFHTKSWGPYELINSHGTCKETVLLCEGHTDFLKVEVMWDDDYQNNRTSILNIQL